MDETPKVLGAEEFVFRRIHKNHTSPDAALSILPVAFRPSKADADGLSVFREELVTPPILAAAGRKPGEYWVVRLSVASLHTLGLSVIADERPDGPPGHALIPELSVASYDRDKERWRAVLVELARLACEAIVHQPAP